MLSDLKKCGRDRTHRFRFAPPWRANSISSWTLKSFLSSVRLRMPELASGSFETTRTHEFSMTSSRSDMAESGRGIQGAEGRREREGALHQKRRCISVHGGSSNRSGNPARSLFRSTSSFRSSHRSLYQPRLQRPPELSKVVKYSEIFLASLTALTGRGRCLTVSQTRA